MALGGDIYQKVYAELGFNDHRENPDDPVEVQYAPSHSVRLVAGSWFAELMGKDEIQVNSCTARPFVTWARGWKCWPPPRMA